MALSDLVDSLTSSNLRLVVVAGILLVGAVGGAYAFGVVGAPAVTGVDNRFGDVEETTTIIESNLHVSNPNPATIQLGGLSIDYVVNMNDVEMAHGKKSGVTVERGNSTLPFTTEMNNEKIPAWWVSHVRNGERTSLQVTADIHSSLLGSTLASPQVEREVETNVIGAFNSTETRPLNANKEPIVSDPILYLNETSATWGTADAERTEIDMEFVVYNPKSTPITVAKIGYDIRMNGISVGEGATDRSYTIPARSTKTLEATTVIDTGTLDEWWVSHLERNQETALEIDFFMEIDLGGLGAGTVRIPLDTMTQTIETDVFGTKDETGSSTDANSSTATPSEGERTTTSNDEQTTTNHDGQTTTDDGETSTSTQSSTPTPTATPTDDGGTTDDGGLLALDSG